LPQCVGAQHSHRASLRGKDAEFLKLVRMLLGWIEQEFFLERGASVRKSKGEG
jgi:hypothetical protein